MLRLLSVAAFLGAILLSGCGMVLPPASPPPIDFNLTITPSALTIQVGGASQSFTVVATSLNNFTEPVNLTFSGLPTGVSASPSTISILPGIQQAITLAAAGNVTPGSVSVNVVGTAGVLMHSAPLSLVVTEPKPDFNLSVTPSTLILNIAGSAQSLNLSADALNGFAENVHIAISGLPAGITASATDLTLTPGTAQTISLTAGSNAAEGSLTLDFTATSGMISHTASATLTVQTSLVTRGLMAFFPTNEGSGTTLGSTVGGYQAIFGGSGNTWNAIGVVLNGSGYISLPEALNAALTVQTYVSQPNNPSIYVGAPVLLSGNGGSANTQWVLTSQHTIPCCSGFQPATMTVASSGVGAGSYTPFAGQNTLSLVMGLASNSTLDTFYIGANRVAMGYVVSSVGGYQTGGNYLVGSNLQGALGPMAYYAVQLTPTEIAQNTAYFNEIMLGRGILQPSNVNLEAIDQFVGLGDSITYGVGGPNTYCSYVTPIEVYGITCLGQPGQKTDFGVSQAPQIALWAATNAMRNIVFIDYITNDIIQEIPPVVSLANLAKTCQEIKQVYPTITTLVGTAMSISTFDSVKDSTNPLIRQMATGNQGCDGFIDIASDPMLGADGASTNDTYFNADEVHPTNTGYSEMGGIITRYINSLDGATASNPRNQAAPTYAMTTADNYINATIVGDGAWTLPECIGLTGKVYTVANKGRGDLVLSAVNSESIAGSASITPNSTGSFQINLVSDATGGCVWTRQ